MNKQEAKEREWMNQTVLSLGFTQEEFEALRRISMTLHRWHELECGTGDGQISISVERDEENGKPYKRVQFPTRNGYVDRRTPIADRETGARKRLAQIMDARNARHAKTVCPNCEQWQHENGDCLNECVKRGFAPSRNLSAYVQTDPRGAALYILRPGDVPAGEQADAYYTRGICVY